MRPAWIEAPGPRVDTCGRGWDREGVARRGRTPLRQDCGPRERARTVRVTRSVRWVIARERRICFERAGHASACDDNVSCARTGFSSESNLRKNPDLWDRGRKRWLLVRQ